MASTTDPISFGNELAARLESVAKEQQNGKKGDTISGVEEIDNDPHMQVTDIFPELKKEHGAAPEVVPAEGKSDSEVAAEEEEASLDDEKGGFCLESNLSTPTSEMINSKLILSLLSSLGFGLGLGISKVKGIKGEKVIIPIAASLAILTLLKKQIELRFNKSSSSNEFSKPLTYGSPKIINSVRSANDLLIKIIARETAELQNKLLKEMNGKQRIINMSQGVPSLKIFDASHKAMVDILNTKSLPYSNVAGHSEVRESAALFVNQFYHQQGEDKFDESNIIITAGAIQAIYNCLSVSIEDSNDIVASTIPAYGLYQQQTKLLRGTFATVDELTPQGLYNLFKTHNIGTKRIRSLVLCVPNNPTGIMITKEQAQELCITLDNIWEEHYSNDPLGGFSVILDEVYLGITARPVESMLTYASPRLRQSMFLILSCSKGLGAMPGARIAWVTSPNKEAISELGKIQLVCTGNASTISQAGLKGSLDFLRANPSEMHKVWVYYHERTSIVVSTLKKLSIKHNLGFIAEGSTATFYVWANFSNLPRIKGKSTNDIEFAKYLRNLYLQKKQNDDDDDSYYCGVAVVPGSAFEVSTYDLKVRFSCACDNINDIHEAMKSIEYGIEEICLNDENNQLNK